MKTDKPSKPIQNNPRYQNSHQNQVVIRISPSFKESQLKHEKKNPKNLEILNICMKKEKHK